MSLILNWAEGLNVDREKLRSGVRIRKADKETRDLLTYLLWDTGLFSNNQIENLMGLAYSIVSQIIGRVRNRVKANIALQEKVEKNELPRRKQRGINRKFS